MHEKNPTLFIANFEQYRWTGIQIKWKLEKHLECHSPSSNSTFRYFTYKMSVNVTHGCVCAAAVQIQQTGEILNAQLIYRLYAPIIADAVRGELFVSCLTRERSGGSTAGRWVDSC